MLHARRLEHELAIFQLCGQATTEMGDFIAHAPLDVEDLLNEVFCLKETVTKLREQKEQATKDLRGRRLEATKLREQVIEMRRAWRTLCKEMGTKP